MYAVTLSPDEGLLTISAKVEQGCEALIEANSKQCFDMLNMTTSTAGILMDIYAANLILILKPDNSSPMLRDRRMTLLRIILPSMTQTNLGNQNKKAPLNYQLLKFATLRATDSSYLALLSDLVSWLFQE